MLQNYFKIAIRNLLRHKAFSVLNILGLAVGIAAALVIFLVVSFELSFDAFHTKKDRIYRVVNEFKHAAGKDYQTGVPFPFGKALQTDHPELEKVAMVFNGNNNQISVLDANGNAGKKFREEITVAFAGPEYFEIFDYKWLSGTAVQALNKPNAVVLSRRMAEKYFGNWQIATGKFLKLDNEALLQVTGILEDLPEHTDLKKEVIISYATIRSLIDAREFTNWRSVWSDSQCYLLLPASTSEKTFNASLVNFLKKHQPEDKNHIYLLQPLHDLHFNPNYPPPSFRSISKQTILALVLIGLFILVIACINFVNLATAQALGRAKEAGVRKVLGSNRKQLVWQFLGETFLIVLLAVLFAAVLVQFMLPVLQPVSNLPENYNVTDNIYLWLFLAGLIGVVTLLSGLYPALVLSGFQPIQALKSKMTIQTIGGVSLRKALVVLQFSVSQVLIIATLIAVSQMDFIQTKDLGFNQKAILLAEIPDDSLAISKISTLRNQFAALPGVEKVSFHSDAPASGNSSMTNFRFTNMAEDEDFPLSMKAADASYFDTFALRFLAGRPYTPSDTARAVVINQMLLEKTGIKNPEDAIGKPISIAGRRYPVVGVVENFHQASLRQKIVPIGLVSQKTSFRQVALKVSGHNLKETQAAVKNIWSAAFPDYVYEATFLDERIAEFYEEEAKLATLFQLFAGVAIFIGCLGLYGLVSFVAVQKTKEIGIRKVLGASLTNIVALLSKDFLKLVILANIIAWPLAWWAMNNWLQDFEYRTPIGWWMFAVAGLGALIIALVTISFQAIKAGLANPVKALKNE
ncbi:ABC transporter permease [Adhaeribacter rhizoryzae]|uniref:FtsX-like permease family protein n=1 Tax=Adhaeribacter rhizoryzae TaxID=2607907 RepID=A0A5M6DNB2_9BACT|nr:ABC transporter permease [Adhaeribacter rhizoryzae]KAA5549024.1 FtsX-like permease family protein [Adhaeribacter rhizoryzae]